MRQVSKVIPQRRLIWLSTLAFAALVGLSGCQTLPDTMTPPWSKKKEPEIPDRILAVWTDTVMHQAGKPAVRGFGGRLFFYKDGNPDPIEVDGGAVVYVFDADDKNPDDPAPKRRLDGPPTNSLLITASRPSATRIACGCPGTKLAGTSAA